MSCDNLYEHQSFNEETGLFKSTFLLVHDDMFGRVQTEDTIRKYLDEDFALPENEGCHYEIEILSHSVINHYGMDKFKPHVNAFVLHIYHKLPVEEFEGHRGMEVDYSYLFPQLNILTEVQYYRPTTVSWNPPKRT